MRLWDVYHREIPSFLSRLAEAPELRRLKDVGMNCGCEYTSFPRFRGMGGYSRYDHSVGAGLIVWHFTLDPVQAAAALFHDIATPVFAHVVDFLRGDYLVQETTEGGTLECIQGSPALLSVLDELGISPEDTADYHRFPLADNDTPRLSADRLEYTLGNLVNFRLSDRETAAGYYEDITVGMNEDGVSELMFRTPETALSFARGALACSRIYVAKEDRYTMQRLSEILGDAIRSGVLSEADLMTAEPAVIRKLTSDPVFQSRWEAFRGMSGIVTADRPGPEEGWRQIPAKKRYIDPAVDGLGRVSRLYPEHGEALSAFLAESFLPWLRGI